MAAREEEGGDGRGREGRGGGEASVALSFVLVYEALKISAGAVGVCRWATHALDVLLTLVDLLVPSPPHLCRRKHTTGAALVPEGCLACAVGTAAGDTGDTGDSASYNGRNLSD